MFIVLENHKGPKQWWELSNVPLTIGRSSQCEICVLDGSMSRKHARVWFDGAAVQVEDLDSSNSTFVNGKAVERAELKPGDTIIAGAHLFNIITELPGELHRPSGPDSTPITLAAGLTVYDKSFGETCVGQAPHRTMSELFELYQLGLALGGVESLDELALILERHLRSQFSPNFIAIAWCYAEGQPPVYLALDGPAQPNESGNRLMDRAMGRREALIKPGVHSDAGNRVPHTWMAVPMIHADEVVGGFLLCGYAPQRLYDEDDLHYALGTATMVAPHIRAVRHAEQLRRDNEALQARSGAGAHLLGESPAIHRVREIISRAAGSALPILILGETGTGKEIAARMLHSASPRHEGPYVVVNCAAIPDHLFESEFFGHEKGAFTGATQQRRGRFEEAHGGTLFLDEIGDLSLDNQARILRAIETSTFHRVGGEKAITVDVRIVAATNKALNEPEFRMDLLHRLNAVTIPMPSLRDRPADIPDLAQHFLRLSSCEGPVHITGLRPDAIARLQKHPWPGNVRELKAAIDRAILFAQGPELTPEDLLLNGHTVSDLNTPAVYDVNQINTPPHLSLAQIERHHIQQVLHACEGNIAKAARTLGINRVTLYKRIAEYGE